MVAAQSADAALAIGRALSSTCVLIEQLLMGNAALADSAASTSDLSYATETRAHAAASKRPQAVCNAPKRSATRLQP